MGAKWIYEVTKPEEFGHIVAKLINLGHHDVLHRKGSGYYWHIGVKSGAGGAFGNPELLKLYEMCSKRSAKSKKPLGTYSEICFSNPPRMQWTVQSPKAIAYLSALLLPNLDYDNKKVFQFLVDLARVEKEAEGKPATVQKFDGIPSPVAKWRIRNNYTAKALSSKLFMAANGWAYLETGQGKITDSWKQKMRFITGNDKLTETHQQWLDGKYPEPTNTLVHQLETYLKESYPEMTLESVEENWHETCPIGLARLNTLKLGGIPTAKEAAILLTDMGYEGEELNQKVKETIDAALKI